MVVGGCACGPVRLCSCTSGLLCKCMQILYCCTDACKACVTAQVLNHYLLYFDAGAEGFTPPAVQDLINKVQVRHSGSCGPHACAHPRMSGLADTAAQQPCLPHLCVCVCVCSPAQSFAFITILMKADAGLFNPTHVGDGAGCAYLLPHPLPRRRPRRRAIPRARAPAPRPAPCARQAPPKP